MTNTIDSNNTEMSTDYKVEILEALMDDNLWGLVSVEHKKGDGILLYSSGASRVNDEPAIEIPHNDPYIVDESTIKDPVTGEVKNAPGVSPPSKTFNQLLSEYGCLQKQRSGFTYVVVDENVCSKRPTRKSHPQDNN